MGEPGCPSFAAKGRYGGRAVIKFSGYQVINVAGYRLSGIETASSRRRGASCSEEGAATHG